MFDAAKSWPFQEARSLLKHIEAKGKKPGDVVTFETGYGPSGSPHIGTFAEVVRTLWVMKAFDAITKNAYKTRLIMFSDDFDGLRKVPDGLPEWMNAWMDMPLAHIPNPYGRETQPSWDAMTLDAKSFGGANNDRLVKFVDDILMSYDGSKVGSGPNRSRVSFISSSESYMVGLFDAMLMRVWDNYEAIMGVMLPTLTERKTTYSPFIPRDETGRFVYNMIPRRSSQPGLMRYVAVKDGMADESIYFEQQVTMGRGKLQWKVDWAMRWVKFEVDYEMSGKDLIDSVKASQRICKILGGVPPVGMTYEMFLDAEGAKVSKSKGNGFSIEEWLTYGSEQSLQMFLFQNPKQARPLHIDLVPKFEDEYVKARQTNPGPNDALWFQHALGSPYLNRVPDVSYSLLLNLAIVSQAETADALVSYLAQQREMDDADRKTLMRMAAKVLLYGQAKGVFDRQGREPTDQEAAAFHELAMRFSMMVPGMGEEAYQYQVYEVGKLHGFAPLRLWFKALYECFFGSSDGPRFGTFTASNGLENTIRLLRTYEGVKEPA